MLTFANEIGNHVRPRLVYSYEVNGETFYASATGASSGLKEGSQVAKALDGIEVVHVRYDPSDPGSSRVLNQDNPTLPFEIDHTVD